MFNPQLDFGSIVDFEGQQYEIEQRKVQLLKEKCGPKEINFMQLEEGDIFKALNKDGSKMLDEYGNDTFIVIDAPFRDELGIPCINIRPYRFKNEEIK